MRSFVLKCMVVFSVTSIPALLLLKIFQRSLYGVDDANIFFVYAKNMVGGNGIVYNIGGERVEGFTSFLWVAIFFQLRPDILAPLVISEENWIYNPDTLKNSFANHAL